MDNKTVRIAKVLEDWNPLGSESIKVRDLNGYRTEAMDILSGLEFSLTEVSLVEIIQSILNDSFMLDLSLDACRPAAEKIEAILNEE